MTQRRKNSQEGKKQGNSVSLEGVSDYKTLILAKMVMYPQSTMC